MGWVKEYGRRNVRSTRRSMGGLTGSQRWPRKTSILPGAVGITTNMFDVVEEALIDFAQNPIRFQYAEMALVHLLAKTSQGIAQGKSRGPVDPQQNRPEAAWRIPVRRITSRYYHGWKIKRLAPNIWEMYNDSREAYFIEYGIHTSPRRKRRPIRKQTVIETFQFAHQTKVAHRLLDQYLGPKGGGVYGQALATSRPPMARVY